MGDHQSMKSWPLMMALLLAPSAAAESLAHLVEHAPLIRLDRQRPPEPGRSYRSLRGSSLDRWSTFALPGERLLLALTPVPPTSTCEVVVDGRDSSRAIVQAGQQGLVPHAWRQSSSMVPGDESDLVAELLIEPQGSSPTAGPANSVGADPLAVRVMALDLSGFPVGRLTASVRIDGVPCMQLEIEILDRLPTTPIEPVLAFYRGRLVEPAEAEWPETVDRRMLEQDLQLLHRAGVTHATYYGAPETLRLATSLWRDSGLTSEPLLVGWYPGPTAQLTPEQLREAELRVRFLRESEEGEPRVFWTVDEPIREEVQLARDKAAIIRAAGGLSTATLQVETAHALRHEIDLPLMDNYLSERPLFDAAVRSVRAAGSTPWGYWQSFGESARFARWNAGFRQLDEPTRGQAFYAYAHAIGDPLDDFDGGYRDMLMVYPAGARVRLITLQLLGLRSGTQDLRLARGAQALVREAKLDDLEHPAVSRLERELERARRKWSSANARWGRYSWDDVARPGRGGPPAAALERTRQRILKAVADLQAARAESSP